MKSPLPFLMIGALLSAPAFAAGMQSQRSSELGSQDYGQPQQSELQSQSSQQEYGQKSSSQQQSQALDPNFVRQIQQQLQQQGYNVGQVDGVMGPNTHQALRQFQQDKGIQAIGIDQQTLAALNISGREQPQQAEVPQQQQQRQQRQQQNLQNQQSQQPSSQERMGQESQ